MNFVLRSFAVTTTYPPEDEHLKSEVLEGFEEAKTFARSLDFEKVKSGEWFIRLLQQVTKAYDRNARATYFQQKYPGLPPDEIADILTSVTVRYATIAGAVAGVAASANQLGLALSGGLTAALFVGTIGAEMVYLSSIQMRLMLDMSVIYDLQLDPEDPEDILMVFGYALGVAPTELVGKGVQIATRAGTTGAIKKYISKGTLQAIQRFAQKLGFKILQRTIIKYAVPMASAAVGSGYNYLTTKSVGQIAKLHFKNRGKVTDELRETISKQNTYALAIPAAAMYMAEVDGEVSPEEKDLYKAMLSRMSFDENTPTDFKKLISDEKSILEAMAQIEDEELKKTLIELLTLMAIYDGVFADEEREFLIKSAEILGMTLDLGQIEDRVDEYKVDIEKNVFEKAAGKVGGAAVTAIGAAGTAVNKLKEAFPKKSKRNGSDSDIPLESTIPDNSFPTSTSPNTVTCENIDAFAQEDPLERLKKLKQLLEAELITQEEFDGKKAEILASI
jgi:tellurite resistance protein